MLEWAAASAGLPPAEQPQYIVLGLKMSGARCGFTRAVATAQAALATSATVVCRDHQRDVAAHDGSVRYEGVYKPRNAHCVQRFSMVHTCQQRMRTAHAAARAELAARLAVFERLFFPAAALVRNELVASGRGDARFLEPGLARLGLAAFSAFCYSEDMNNNLHTDAGPGTECISHRARSVAAGAPHSWTFVNAAAGASFRLAGGDAEHGAVTLQPSFMLHGTPRVTGAAARAANEAAGLLGVAGFASVSVLRAHVVAADGSTLPAEARARAGRDKEAAAATPAPDGGRAARGAKRARSE